MCPFCQSSDVELSGTGTTLLGGPREWNHEWTTCRCRSCKKKCVKESKALHVWYTDESRVLLGMPACYENYVYRCAKCGGDVTRSRRNLNNDEEPGVLVTRLEEGRVVPQYRTFYFCGSCGHGGQTEKAYWTPEENT